jgi:hypothetical protein
MVGLLASLMRKSSILSLFDLLGFFESHVPIKGFVRQDAVVRRSLRL